MSRKPLAQPSSTVPPKSIFREYFETIVICVLFLVAARGFLFMQSKIPTESMVPTLLVGDYILVNRFIFGAPGDPPNRLLAQREIQRGDVVVFRFPEDPDVDYVKRVIGLPGDTVEVRNGVLFVNGVQPQEPQTNPNNPSPPTSHYPLTTVPAESYFCMGDNRGSSSDSRVWGFLPRSLVKGRAFFIWYSYDEVKNDHTNTGLKRWVSIGRKLINPQKIRFSRMFSRIH